MRLGDWIWRSKRGVDLLTVPLLPWKEVPAWVGGWGKATTGRREVRKGISVESTGNGSSRGWGQGKLPKVVCCRAVD